MAETDTTGCVLSVYTALAFLPMVTATWIIIVGDDVLIVLPTSGANKNCQMYVVSCEWGIILAPEIKLKESW